MKETNTDRETQRFHGPYFKSTSRFVPTKSNPDLTKTVMSSQIFMPLPNHLQLKFKVPLVFRQLAV